MEALTCALHTKSWAQYGDHPEVVLTQTGGRQGCQLGSIILNSTYAIAILYVHRQLTEKGLVFRCALRDGPFWASAELGAVSEHVTVIDATFVDGECLVLMTASPHDLQHAVESLLEF